MKLSSVILISALLLAACSTVTPQSDSPQPTTSARIIPYRTPTASQTVSAPTVISSIEVTPQPTSTPYTHTIIKGDTLLEVALQYGVSLDDLKAANPKIDPNFLIVGQTLIVPLPGVDPVTLPTPTPVPLALEEPTCYPSGDGGAWCYVLVRNERETALENLIVQVGLFDSDEKSLASENAVPPVNRVMPGQSLPLAAYFLPPLPAGFTARAGLLAAIEVNDPGSRYLETEVVLDSVEVGHAGDQATARGSLVVSSTLSARTAWVVAIAYDENGKVAGLRKWDSTADENCSTSQPAAIESTSAPPNTAAPTGESTAAGSSLPPECLRFDLTVYSLGPRIGRVEVIAEVRP